MESSIRTIVVGVADIQEEDPHLAPAIRLADALGATLHVVHGYHLPDPVLYPYPEMSAFSPEAIQQIEEQTQARLVAHVREVAGDDRIVCRAVAAAADAAILGVAEEVNADLIVVGATRRGTLARTILGTTAQRVTRGAKRPVLVNRRPDQETPQRVLFTTDLTDESARVYEHGRRLAAMLGHPSDAQRRLLLVVGYDAPPTLPKQVVVEHATANFDRFIEEVEPGAPASLGKIRTGDPAKEIVAEAAEWGADLLVVGTHGRKGPSRFLIGSVAEGVVRNALCDVLVIPIAAVGGPQKNASDAGGQGAR